VVSGFRGRGRQLITVNRQPLYINKINIYIIYLIVLCRFFTTLKYKNRVSSYFPQLILFTTPSPSIIQLCLSLSLLSSLYFMQPRRYWPCFRDSEPDFGLSIVGVYGFVGENGHGQHRVRFSLEFGQGRDPPSATAQDEQSFGQPMT
jgi:hypothetical protein